MPRGPLCNAKTRKGGSCLRPAGWGTDHAGFGACKWHGGASPTGRKAGARAQALAFARGALGAEVAASPVDAMEEAVRLSVGLIAFYRHELATAAAKLGTDEEAAARARIEVLRPAYTEAVKLEKDVAKAALDAGVAERRQRLAERMAELLAAAIADGLQEAFGDVATPERRAVFARVVKARLLVLDAQEDGPLGLPAAA